MKFAIDVQSAVTQKAGVGRYTRELVDHLAAAVVPPDQLVLSYFDFRRDAIPFTVPNAEVRPVRWIPGRLAQFAWKSMHFPPYDWLTGKADLFHFPNFIIPPLRRGKAVVTIHDLAFMRYPQFAENRNVQFLNRNIRHTAARADAVITVSKFSAQEVGTYLDVPPERVFPIYHGIDKRFCRPDAETLKQSLAALGLDRPYLLTVGTIEPRKNIPHLIRVFEMMKDFDGDLVIAGGKGWKFEPILERIRNSPRAASIKCIGFASDEVLPSLYAGATVFLLASFYEGFGFPPVESMACGTPVVSSTGGSLEEVLGDGAALLNQFDEDRWTETIRKVIHDSEYRGDLVQRGLRQASLYSWQDTARRTLDVYRQVAAR
jgi:glycosyltransferase involved in cell wall biosynthesis